MQQRRSTHANAHLISQIVICRVQADSQEYSEIAADVRNKRDNAAGAQSYATMTDGDAVTCVRE